ncbi:hypothetical protein COCOBI_04-4850 [Coccomyxa sp. Obi]|nr:hypothetical protein COCOBI_04-4850 [Coccomyxa sp. Obi]
MQRDLSAAGAAAEAGFCASFPRVAFGADGPTLEGGDFGTTMKRSHNGTLKASQTGNEGSVEQLGELVNNTEQQGAAKRERITVPDQPSKSSDEAQQMELRSKTAGAATQWADANLPVVESPDTQQQKADGSVSPAELLEEAKKIVGNDPLYIAAERYPVEAWRVWTITYPREYNEESKACNPLCPC